MSSSHTRTHTKGTTSINISVVEMQPTTAPSSQHEVTAAAYFATAQPKKRPQLVDADASESGKKVFSNADSISSLPPSYGSISAASACPPPPAYERFPRFEPIHSHPPVSVIDFSAGRNLLNKKEVPPSTIKESSESSQTIDEQDGDKAGKTLNHENTVVRVDTSAKAQAQAHAQLQQKAQGGSNTNSPRPAALPGSQTLGVPSGSAPSEVVHFMASCEFARASLLPMTTLAFEHSPPAVCCCSSSLMPFIVLHIPNSTPVICSL
ncbi:Calcium/calmodulin-dependent protein kinase type II [Toxocara canis]|uniref:Calcium/calmodulin-dependent protein kinase type II n=1 Tax=Toxocara canis TaxID=6265 RepID=A0A0B2VIA5_TOXCA|nr:Calcium/calmodulin-dependent protein kinase type II [Toxocara canis]